MSEDINKKIEEVIDKLTAIMEEGSKSVAETLQTSGKSFADTMEETGKKVVGTLESEKKKAEIRSEIGHTDRELTKAYEKLGREYYAAKTAGHDLAKDNETFDLIKTKEKLIELLGQELDRMEKETQE